LREINYCNGVKRFIKYTLSNPKILVDAVLNFHVKDVKIKVSRSRCYYDTSSRKKVLREVLMLICTCRIICSIQDHSIKDG